MKFAYLIEPPFNFRTADGAVSGCDVALARHVFAELGIDDFEPVETEFSELLPGLEGGRWRMTTGLFATDERRALASFSLPIWALPDGLLVQDGNPLAISGYRSVTEQPGCILAVIRDQFQHQTALALGVPAERIMIFETYAEAANAVRTGRANAYASVGRAHGGFIDQNPDLGVELVIVPPAEKPPMCGSFAFARTDEELRRAVDGVLEGYLGSAAHRQMMSGYGFSAAEIDLLLK